MSAVNFIRELDARFTDLLMGSGGRDDGDLDAVWTIGTIGVTPGTASIIPGTASITVQYRHPSEAVLDDMTSTLMSVVDKLDDLDTDGASNPYASWGGVRISADKVRE